MIVTLTPNPSVDRTIEVEVLHRGAVLRARSSRVDPGGKGVNVSRALAANGRKTRAVLPGGGWEGEQLAALLAPADVPVVVVPVAEPVRANVSVVEPDGTVTKLNELGPRLSPEEVEALTAATVAAAADAEWLACTGSLPPGAPIDFYASVVERLGTASVKVAVDSSGAPLVAALEAGPDLVKPNREELAEATGRTVTTLGEVVAAAEQLRAQGAGAVLASLGADGAVLVEAGRATYGHARVERPRSAVGAGDAMLAGFLAAGGSGPEALAEALAWGAAAASLPGSRMPTPDDLDHAAVSLADRIDPDRPLTERS
ncbi:MAG TPA: 1-phosphofructokinase [Actinomycetes bacterium]|nr:1-phosphofructokinase [Actinomycetes bacterium]